VAPLDRNLSPELEVDGMVPAKPGTQCLSEEESDGQKVVTVVRLSTPKKKLSRPSISQSNVVY